MSKRSLEELVTGADLSALHLLVQWRLGRRNGQANAGPNAAALIQRAAHDIGMLRTAVHS